MKAAWQKYLAFSAPRYTSYPSALFFEPMGRAPFAGALSRVSEYEPVSVYVHIPYCAQLCWYCGCTMRVENRYERTRPYIDALHAEIRAVGAALNGHGRTTQLHFGGGTPNFLHEDDFIGLLDAIEIAFGLTDGTPIAVELDPRLASTRQIAVLARLGVTRMSLGVQDFDPVVQAAINRIQPYEMIHDRVAAMRAAGIADVSFDLLYGLPCQSEARFADTLRKALSLAPDRISLFGYSHLPQRLRHQRLIREEDLPSRQLRLALAELGAETLGAAGYVRIGFDHFALPHTAIARAARAGRLNRNFQGFTEDPARSVIGLGASAISSVHGVHAQNEKDVAAYCRSVEAAGQATARGVVATREQRRIGDWIHDFLCRNEASLARYFSEVATDESEMRRIMSALSPMVADGLVILTEDRIALAPEARAMARLVAAIFDPAVARPESSSSDGAGAAPAPSMSPAV